MSQILAYNIVLFMPAGATGASSGVALTLDRPWKLSAGLKPDINQATCPAPEFGKITDVNQPGSMQFYFSKNPASANASEPDFTIADVKLVDIEPMQLGTYIAVTSSDLTPQAGFVEYRLSFADFREAWQAPRGGRLSYGMINPGNAGQPTSTTSTSSTSTTSHPHAAPELTMTQLVTLCVLSMGLAVPAGGLPATLDAVAAPRNLKWFGNHAAAELEKLLTLAGHVFCPHWDGTFTIEQMTGAGTPALTTGNFSYAALPAGTASKIDSRGRYVVITSAPTRAINTETISGPDEDNFSFVVWDDSQSKWRTTADFYGSDAQAAAALQAWLSGGATALQSVQGLSAAQQDPAVATQVFSFVRLAWSLADPTVSPILTTRYEADGTTGPPQITATGAAQSNQGVWYNSTGSVSIRATHRIDGNVLSLAAPVFTVDGSGNFQPIADDAMTIRVSIEQFQANPAAQGDTTGAQPQFVPYYYMSGWQAAVGGGAPTQLDDDATQAIVSGQTKGAIIIDRPELLLLIVDQNEINRAALDTVAATIAAQYLKGGATKTTQSYVGFAGYQPSGLVTSVEWDQKAVLTTLHCNDWYTAEAAVGIHGVRKLEGGNGTGQAASEAHPHESKTQSDRSSLGASGDSARVLPLMPAPAVIEGGGDQWVWSTGGIAGIGGAYNGMVLTNPGQAITVSAGSISINFASGGAGQIQGTPCAIIVPAENNRTTQNLPTQRLLRGSPMPSMSAALGLAAGIPTYWVEWDPDSIRDVVWDPINHLLWDSTFASPTVPQQKTIVQFVDCTTGT